MGNKRLLPLLLLAFTTGCTSISAPAEEMPTFPLPEPPVVVAPNLEFTLAFYGGESLHPTLVSNETNSKLAPLLYEGLYVVDEQFQAQFSLAESHTVSEDGLRWVITVKEGIPFWDGTALTGRIVASALNEARGETSLYTPRFRDVNSITASGQEVTITLNSPNFNLPVLLDVPISYGGGLRPQGTGPYYVAEDRLLHSETWWGTGDLPQQILLEEIASTEDLISAFDGGNLSLLDGDLTGNQHFGYSGNYEVWEYPSTSLYYLGFDSTREDLSPLLRRMLSEALDRQSLVNQVLAGYGTATSYPVHPSVSLGLTERNYDPLASGEAFSNYGAVPSLTLVVNGDSSEKTKMAEEIAAQWKEFGVEIIVNPLSWYDYQEALLFEEFDLYLSEVYLTADFDLRSILFPDGAYNFGRYEDYAFVELWDSYRLWGLGEEPNVFSYFYEQMPIVPICFQNGTALSLWGHLSYATPLQHHLFYGLEDWVVEVP